MRQPKAGDPSDISNSTVLTQTEFSYDDAGNRTAMKIRQRFDNATGDGELMDPLTEPRARVSYTATYPDAIGRTQAQAGYGSEWRRGMGARGHGGGAFGHRGGVEFCVQ